MSARWAYLGPQGTFSEQAARDFAAREPGDLELVPCVGVAAAIEALRRGEVSAACVPLESSVEGVVPITQDELTHGEPLMITAEAFVPITFDLLTRPGTALDRVATVGSHPHGHAQVRAWVTAHLPQARVVETTSTAAAAAAVAAGDLDAAAAAPMAGRTYGLASLATDIGGVRDALTRFVLLRSPGVPPAATGNDRTSMVLTVANRPGSLLEMLSEFSTRGINLTRLESRPTRERMGEYLFQVDIDGHIGQSAVADTVAALIRRNALLRFLGSYPRANGNAVAVPEFATDQRYDAATEEVEKLRSGGQN